MSTVIFDLDSTLADTRQRRVFMPTNPQGPADWVDYHSRCTEDAPIPGRIALARLLSGRHRVIIVTARPNEETVKARTVAWLYEHRVPFRDIVFMPLDETRSTGEWKAAEVARLQELFDVVLFVDDWWQNGDELEKLGVPFLHVTPPGIGRPGLFQAAKPRPDFEFDLEVDQGLRGWVPQRPRDGWSWAGPAFVDEVQRMAKVVADATAPAEPEYVYRVVERTVPQDDATDYGPWTWSRTSYTHPRTFRTLAVARGQATKTREGFERHDIPMEVAVQRAPVGTWEVVE